MMTVETSIYSFLNLTMKYASKRGVNQRSKLVGSTSLLKCENQSVISLLKYENQSVNSLLKYENQSVISLLKCENQSVISLMKCEDQTVPY